MTKEIHRMCPLAVAIAIAVAAVPAQAANKVIVTGTMLDMQQQGQFPGNTNDPELFLQSVCTAADKLGMYMGPAEVELANQMAKAGLDSSVLSEAMQHLGDAIDEACKLDFDDDEITMGPFLIVYANCMMRMESDLGTMAIRLPPDGHDAVMEVTDYTSEQGTQFALLATQTGMASVVTGRGEATAVNMSPTGDSKEIAGHPTEEYTFDYSMNLGGDGVLETMLGPAAAAGFGDTLASMSKITSNGTVWVAPTAPGSDIVRTFYNNLATILENAQGAGTFFSGTLRNLYELVKHGMPLEIEQTSKAAMGMTSTSWSKVESITLRPMDPGECGWTTIPEGFEVTDMNQQMAGMGGASGSGAAGAPTGTTAAGMTAEQAEQMNQAMGSMTDEQKQALEGMGLGSMMQQMMGANPAGQPASAPAGGAPSGKSGTSSAELTSDNLTQSVQNHLQALGYSVGNTNGELDTNTIIAISQFQAENGMKVTGEVTPQLLGILGAKVDSP